MYYWTKIPDYFFDRNDIKLVEASNNGKNILLIYLKLISESSETYGVVSQKVRRLHGLIDVPIQEVEEALPVLKKFGLIFEINEEEYQLKDCNKDTVYRSSDASGRDRNTTEYKQWRKAVFERDRYTCQHCDKTGCRLEAHHIVPWAKDVDLRFETNNGITLCKACHLKEHRR